MKRRQFIQASGLLTTAGYLSRANLLPGPFLRDDFGSNQLHKATIRESGDLLLLENQFVSFAFDRATGTYGITNRTAGMAALTGAALKINEWSSGDAGFSVSWKRRNVTGHSGKGLALDLLLEKPGVPRLLFTVVLCHAAGYLALSGGIVNSLDHPVSVKEIHAVSNALLYPGTDVSENFAMIDGFSGGEPLEYGERLYSPLTRSNALRSRNNLLLTFTHKGRRQAAVFGGLAYADFEKFAWIEQPRATELEKGADGKSSLLCYLNLPFDTASQNGAHERLRVESDLTLQQWAYSEFRCGETATAGVAPGQLILAGDNFDPAKSYWLGFSWWNGYQHGDHEDNHQSVFIEYEEGGKYSRIPLLTHQTIPRFDGVKKRDVEQVELALPVKATRTGSFRLIFTKSDGPEKDHNVYLGEIWLRDGSCKPMLPDVPTPVKDSVQPRRSYNAHLFARDPVGKKVDPGATYIPRDAFYIDVTSEDPFGALETYGSVVSVAQAVKLPFYDFPTVCLWYAESTAYGNSGAENSTPGAVREMRHIRESGFLRYCRAAVRLVPDSYMPDNQQGWWDDVHWQREVKPHVGGKHGRYLPPYETSEKWGRAVTELGGIPLTYFQTAYRSEDYARAFPGHMLFNKTYAWKNGVKDTKGELFTSWKNTWIRNGRVVWGYDFTDPGFLEHLNGVYGQLRKGGIRGLMFDYPFSGWASDGGMEDAYATTAAAYRNIFRYANDGLGPGAYVHERNMERGSDVTIGLVASMRTENDTDTMDSAMVTRCGLRWYKNRVLVNHDTDSKNLVRLQQDRDAVRAVLTMCYVVSGRLLLANSFSRFSAATLRDLSRTFPYHTAHKSARPVDAFVSPVPMVYDFDINDQWHQVTFYNPDPKKEMTIGIDISGERAAGSLSLDKHRSWLVYDFWNDRFAGRYEGTARLEQVLRPGEARMLSVRQEEEVPQLVSADRHIMQGYVETVALKWNPNANTLSGTSRIIGNDPYVISIATNGYHCLGGYSRDRSVRTSVLQEKNGLVKFSMESAVNTEACWEVAFEAR